MTSPAKNLTNPSVVGKILKEHDLRLYKGLGQNFLIDGNIRNLIVNAADLRDTDRVLEVGGGIGTLTQAVLPRVEMVIVVEIDERLAAVLKENFEGYDSLEIIRSDVMDLDIYQLLRRWGVNKIVSNLPYNVATPLIVDVLEQTAYQIESMVLMIQREVAERLAAGTGSPAYGAASVIVQSLSSVEIIHNVGRKVFVPQPKVDSSIVRIIPGKVPEGYVLLKEVIKTAFSQRRKKAAKLLAARYSLSTGEIERCFTRSDVRTEVRAEEISPEAFAMISNCIGEALS